MREIRFGLVIPQGRSYDFVFNKEVEKQEENHNPIKQYEYSKTIAKTADKSQFESIYTYDHFLPYYAPNSEKSFFECFTLLSSIAAVINKIKIGQVVTCNSYRNPALLAKMFSTLDVISNGKTELGIGAGWHKEEYLQYGYEFPSDITRIRQLDEALYIIKSMWTEDKPTFIGKYYSIKNATCNPKPVQKPHPVIMVGGIGEKYLLKVVARHADRYNHPCGSAEDLKRKISVLRDHCSAIGRDHREIEYSVLIECLIKETQEQISEEIKGRRKIQGLQLNEAKYTSAIGTPDKIISALRKYINIGITHFIINFTTLDEKTVRLFDSKVIRKI